MFKAVIKKPPLFLALLTASLFVFGLTFHQGYLEYWGLEESMFQLSFEKTLFQGFLAPHYFGVEALVIALVLWVVVAPAYLIILLASGWVGRKLVSSWIWQLFDGLVKKKDQEIPPHLKKPILLILIPYWGFSILIALMSILAIAGYLGRQAGSD